MGQEPLHSWRCIWTYCQLGHYAADAVCLVARGGDNRLQAYYKYNVSTRLTQLYMYIVEIASSRLQKRILIRGNLCVARTVCDWV